MYVTNRLQLINLTKCEIKMQLIVDLPVGLGVIVFNATFNNISVISWLYPEKTTDLSQV